jgi:hypothetical protein
MIWAEKTPVVWRQVRIILADVSHAGIVRGNMVKVNTKIQTVMKGKFILISNQGYKIQLAG